MTCRLLAAIFAAATVAAFAPRADAAASDYRFDVISAAAAGSGKTDVTLRLTHLPDGKPVPGSIIFQPRAVMAGMEDAPGAAVAEAGPAPGMYVLHVATAMAGPWTLQLSAKVQGEADTLHAALPFQAGP